MTPVSASGVHTLVALNIQSCRASLSRAYPITSSEDPYIGDESITVPPASKKAFRTRVRASRSRVLPPTLNVIQDPMPITGTWRLDFGIVRRIGTPPAARTGGIAGVSIVASIVPDAAATNARRPILGGYTDGCFVMTLYFPGPDEIRA